MSLPNDHLIIDWKGIRRCNVTINAVLKSNCLCKRVGHLFSVIHAAQGVAVRFYSNSHNRRSGSSLIMCQYCQESWKCQHLNIKSKHFISSFLVEAFAQLPELGGATAASTTTVCGSLLLVVVC